MDKIYYLRLSQLRQIIMLFKFYLSDKITQKLNQSNGVNVWIHNHFQELISFYFKNHAHS